MERHPIIGLDLVLKMDYSRVQRFFKKYKTENPGGVAAHFLAKIKRKNWEGKDITPKKVLTKIIEDVSYKEWRSEHIKVIKENYEDALFVAEYYIMWAKLSQEDKEIIRELRAEIDEWAYELVSFDKRLIKNMVINLCKEEISQDKKEKYIQDRLKFFNKKEEN